MSRITSILPSFEELEAVRARLMKAQAAKAQRNQAGKPAPQPAKENG